MLLILIILLLVIVILKGAHPFGKRQSQFASEPEKGITRIELRENEKTVILSNEEDGWKVNGKEEARKNGILFLLRILTEMQIKSPVSPEFFDEEITLKGIQPVRVKVFEDKRLLKSFMVFRTSSNQYGNIMRRGENRLPFIVYLPGYEGDIGSEFISNEIFWAPYTLFNIHPSEIADLELENISDTLSSFRISVSGDVYLLSDTRKTLSGWDTSRVRRYISYFTWVPFESPAFSLSEDEKKMIESQTPIFRISVTKKDGDQVRVHLWERIEGDKIDRDRLWVKVEGNDVLFVARYFDIDPLLKRVTYFLTDQEVTGNG